VSAPVGGDIYVAPTTPFVCEVKQLPIMAILIYAFFKFRLGLPAVALRGRATSPVILILARRDFFP